MTGSAINDSSSPVPRLPAVLIVYDCIHPDSLGGVEHRNHAIAEHLEKRGYHVVRAGWWFGAGGRAPDPGVLALPHATRIHDAHGRRSLTSALRFAIATWRLPLCAFDIVEAANIPFLHLLPLSIRCFWAGKPLLVTWHEYWGVHWRDYVGRLRAPAYAAVEWLCGQLGTRAVAVSPTTAQRLRGHRVRCDDVRVIPCGVPIERIDAATAGTTRDGATMVYVGRLIAEKRVDLVIRALPLVSASNSVTLRVIGDGPELERLRMLTARLGLNDRVSFAGRVESPEVVWREIARARVAVQASSREGFGMFPLEAMACGTPVVYCDAGNSAVSDLVPNGVLGFGADPSPGSIAEKVRILLDPDIWRRFSHAGVCAANEYRWESVVDRVERVLREIVATAD